MSRAAPTPLLVEKAVPIPTGRPSRFPLADLQVGDSFLAPFERPLEQDTRNNALAWRDTDQYRDVYATRRSVASAMKTHARKSGWTFKSMTERNGVRVWRIA